MHCHVLTSTVVVENVVDSNAVVELIMRLCIALLYSETPLILSLIVFDLA